jgi:hypothetical protein
VISEPRTGLIYCPKKIFTVSISGSSSREWKHNTKRMACAGAEATEMLARSAPVKVRLEEEVASVAPVLCREERVGDGTKWVIFGAAQGAEGPFTG